MRRFEVTPAPESVLRFRREGETALAQWLTEEVEDALSARKEMDDEDEECLRQYNAVPRYARRDVPIENAPNVEITIGAIASDALYAQALSTIFTQNPILTTRPTRRADAEPELVEAVKGLQDFSNWGVDNEWGLRVAMNHAYLDVTQLGTGGAYVPYVEHIRKTRTRRVIDFGPRIIAIPKEDLMLPGGAHADPARWPWVGFRMWMTESEVNEHGEDPDERTRWDVRGFKPVGSIGVIRSKRELFGRTRSNAKLKKLYEVYTLFCRFDYDGDGIDEDLLVVWDRTSRAIGWRDYNPYDTLPILHGNYQDRAHLPWGLGVLSMLRPYEEEITEGHNDRTLNVKLANMRGFVTRTGQVDEGTLRMWGNRNIEVADPKNDVAPFQLGEVYPSAFNNETVTMQLAERRVGLSELSIPRPSQVLGSRTPAFTTASLLQRESNRFAPAFDNMRDFAADCVKQCLLRYRERLLANDEPAMENIRRVLGDERGDLVIRLLRTDDFLENVSVELTASNASVSREADKQNAMLILNMMLSYYEKALNLLVLVSQPNVPEPVQDAAKKIADKTSELIERVLRTFDQIRDPEAFIADFSEELDQLKIGSGAMQGIQQLLGGVLGQPNGGIAEQLALPGSQG